MELYQLTEEEETKLADYLFQMSEMGYGLSQEGVMGLAYSIVKKSKRPHPFQNGSAGRAWFEGFMKRKPNLTIRSPNCLRLAAIYVWKWIMSKRI